MSHIIHQDPSERESVAIQRLLATMPLREYMFGGMGTCSWFIMELRFSTLGMDEHGEIDIIGGLLAPADWTAYRSVYDDEAARLPGRPAQFIDMLATRRYFADGGMAWPPRTDFLVGVEVKCEYEHEGVIRARKDSPEKVRGVRKQLQRDLNLGLDYVGYLDIIANQPMTGDHPGAAWWAASGKSFRSFQLSQPFLDERVPENSPIGQWVWSVGAVAGKDERFAGAGAPRLLREPRRNPHTPRRARLEELLAKLLATVPRSTTYPVLLKDCRQCNTLHVFHEIDDITPCTRDAAT